MTTFKWSDETEAQIELMTRACAFVEHHMACAHVATVIFNVTGVFEPHIVQCAVDTYFNWDYDQEDNTPSEEIWRKCIIIALKKLVRRDTPKPIRGAMTASWLRDYYSVSMFPEFFNLSNRQY